jgi:hypothetical protein
MMVNWLAVVVIAIAYNIFGMLWYSPSVFGTQWMKLSGLTKADMDKIRKRGMGKSYTGMIIASLVMAYVLTWFIDATGATTFADGAWLGFYAWLGFLATTMLNPVLWKNSPFTLYLLDTAHYLIALVVSAGVLTVWV